MFTEKKKPVEDKLTKEEQMVLASKWGQIVCIYCGGYHHGFCNRIKRAELDEFGRPRVIVFWDNWTPDPRTIWPEDVWQTQDEIFRDLEQQARKAEQEQAIKRLQQTKAPQSERKSSPRDLIARITSSE